MIDGELNFETLKTRERELRAGLDEHLALRVHRTISWLGRAEREIADEDFDAAFIFYWIAFNSIYSSDHFYARARNEKDRFSRFFGMIVELDRNQIVYNAIWIRFSDSIRILLNNQYVFQPYWESLNRGDESWKILFERNNRQTLDAFSQKNTETVLCKLFDRLYVLRNQLMHGGATWNSSVNRSQVRDGTQIVKFLIPIFVDILMRYPDHPWGKPFYPVIDA